MENMLPYQNDCLGVSGIVNILDAYANRCSTPTPEPVFFETPASCFDRFEIKCDYDMNMSLDELSVGDVSIPALDFDDTY